MRGLGAARRAPFAGTPLSGAAEGDGEAEADAEADAEVDAAGSSSSTSTSGVVMLMGPRFGMKGRGEGEVGAEAGEVGMSDEADCCEPLAGRSGEVGMGELARLGA